MATITYTMQNPRRGEYIITWANMANGDVGLPADVGHLPDKVVTVTGTFGAGGNCRFQGTNVRVSPGASDWQTFNDPQGNALDFTAAKQEQLLENPYQCRPNITAGDGTTSLTVILHAFQGQ